MNETHHVDFTFKLAGVRYIDPTGLEKYQKDDGRTWLMNDLENHVNVKVKQTEKLVEIHVFSSVLSGRPHIVVLPLCSWNFVFVRNK